MTRDDVARECQKRGWELDAHGDESWYVVGLVEEGDARPLLGLGPSPREAYLDACQREGVAPF